MVKYLVSQGVSEPHLVPAGFGDSRPLDAGDTDEAYAKNRRIEFKLTDGYSGVLALARYRRSQQPLSCDF